MEHKESLGKRLAMAVSDASLTVEGGVLANTIYAHPVELAPTFVPLDPFQTWLRRDEPRAIPAKVERRDWAARRILLPATVDPKASAARLLAGLAGCPGTLSFEAIVTGRVTRLYLVSRQEQMEFYANAWELEYPESVTLPADDPLQDLPSLSVILDLYAGASYDWLVTASGSFWGQFCRIAGMLKAGDVLVYQVVFLPVHAPWQKNIALLSHGRRSDAKPLDEPLFAVSIRLATTNKNLIGPLGALAGYFTSAGLSFSYRSASDFLQVISPADVLAMFRERCSFTLGQFLVSSELGLFIHPPDPAVAHNVELGKGLPVPERFRHEGLVLGTNDDRGERITVHYDWESRYVTHAALPGGTGTGKSTALNNWIAGLSVQGAGICFLDPHRRGAERLLGGLPGVRDRVVYLDFEDDLPIAYNPFVHARAEDFGGLAGDFVQTLTTLFDTEGRPQINHFLRNGLYALFVLGLNFGKLPELFSPSSEGESLRARVIQNVRHEAVLRFWRDEFPKLGQRVAPVHNRLLGLLFHEKTARTFNQHENKVDLAGFMRDRAVVIVALPSNWEAARIVGGFLIGQFKHLAMRRRVTDPQFFVIVDECGRFEGTPFQEIIDQTAKGRLSLWLAHQTTSQLPAELKRTIQFVDTFVFGMNKDDSRHYSSLLDDKVSPETLRNLPTGAVYARIGKDVVNFQCPPPLPYDEGLAAEIRAASRARYYATESVPQQELSRRSRVIDTL